MERIYPSYLDKVKRNNEKAVKTPAAFAKRLNYEYTKARKSKAKTNQRLEFLPVRLYGSGDFIPEHINFIKLLKFKTFIISKNLTRSELNSYIDLLLKVPNITSILLSFDDKNILNYNNVIKYIGKDRIKTCFTGLPDELIKRKKEGYNFDVFFNISDKKAIKKQAEDLKESCPTDAGVIRLQKACTYCNRCWQSSVTSTSDWNKLQT